MAEFDNMRASWPNTAARLAACLAALMLVVAGGAGAQTMKRYLTPDGRTIYSDKPVPGAKLVGEVPSPPPLDPAAVEAARQRERALAEKVDRRVEERLEEEAAARKRVEQATARLEAARRELEAGRTPRPGERIGTAGGGSRFTEEYLKRQSANEEAVRQAEEALEKARGR